jgi:hypothetical protein
MLRQHRQRDLAHALVLPLAIGRLHPPCADETAQTAIGCAGFGVGEEGQPLDGLDPAADHGLELQRFRLGVEPHHAGHRIDVGNAQRIISCCVRRQHQIDRIRRTAQEAEAAEQTQFDEIRARRRGDPVGIELQGALVGGERRVGHQPALSRSRTAVRSAANKRACSSRAGPSNRNR